MKLASVLLIATLMLGIALCVSENADMGAIAHAMPVGLCLAMATAPLVVKLLGRPCAIGWVSSRPTAHVESVTVHIPDPPPKPLSRA